MIKQWVAIMVFGSAWLSGGVSAGLFSQGENIGFSISNYSDKDIEKVEVMGIYQDGKKIELYSTSSSQSRIRYLTPGQPIYGFIGNTQYMSDTGHKVPEEVDVRWRKMPREGQAIYKGDPIGSFRIKVRSRIPPQALQLAGRDGYSLGLTFSVGKEPVLLCWGVVTKKGASLLGAIMSGGQCKPEDVAWRSDIDWRKSGVWFPEPISADQETK